MQHSARCSSTTSSLPPCRSDDECASALELRIRAEEEVLTGALRAAEVSLPGEPPGPGSSVVLVPAMPQLELKAAVKPPGPPGCGEGPPTSLQPPGLESLEQNTRFVFTLTGRMQQTLDAFPLQFFLQSAM